MLVLFQRKIVYMGYVPPGSRYEQLSSDTVNIPANVICSHVQILSSDGIVVSTLITEQNNPPAVVKEAPHWVMLYLQGNAGSPLHRIPLFSSLFSSIQTISSPIFLTVVAPAPRSYWLTHLETLSLSSIIRRPWRPTESGILSDYRHVLAYIQRTWPDSHIILYGHSLGGAAAVKFLNQLNNDITCSTQSNISEVGKPDSKRDAGTNGSQIQGLILENPMGSIPDMVPALYPQWYLPYRYLGVFAFDKWDATGAMKRVFEDTTRSSNSTLKRVAGRALVLLSEKDELVPNSMGRELFDLGDATKLESSKLVPELKTVNSSEEITSSRRIVVIKDALHENMWTHREWSTEMRQYFNALTRRTKRS